MELPYVVAFVTFLAVMLLGTALYVYMERREVLGVWRRRAEGHERGLELEQPSENILDAAQAQMHAVLEWFAKWNQPSNAEETKATRRLLVTAGYRSRKAPIFFIGSKLLLAVALVVLFAMVPVKLLGFPSTNAMLFYYVCLAACGYYAPSVWLKHMIAIRQDTLQRAIPDALDLMVVCVEAGLGLDQAIGRVGQEVSPAHPALGDELNLLSQELRTGVQRQAALRNLAHRTDLEEVRNLVALLVQTDRFGTSIGQALRVHADSMRTTRRLKAEELAAKLPVKLLFPLICFIFPSMFIVTIGPACIRMVRVLFPAMTGQ
ncbi:MAG: type II secretion system F family protein [Nitrospira sp.]|nr:type II secretion system F family protein [Nitrospira sp.]MDH4369616.1 type II secretion system F family protein [Nitrospira sp.]MDH5497135.1 type II secretion system F family protein [Nitrospira sp.]MDH5725862.1 type II secretion system F family protein [Nitrospira sp.]